MVRISTKKSNSPKEASIMKPAKELLQAYIDGSALESAALFAEQGALELPYLADLGVPPRYEGPKNIGAFLTFLHEKMYPGFKFVDVKIYIDTPDQAFGEYTIHQKSGISGKDVHQRFLRLQRAELQPELERNALQQAKDFQTEEYRKRVAHY